MSVAGTSPRVSPGRAAPAGLVVASGQVERLTGGAAAAAAAVAIAAIGLVWVVGEHGESLPSASPVSGSASGAAPEAADLVQVVSPMRAAGQDGAAGIVVRPHAQAPPARPAAVPAAAREASPAAATVPSARDVDAREQSGSSRAEGGSSHDVEESAGGGDAPVARQEPEVARHGDEAWWESWREESRWRDGGGERWWSERSRDRFRDHFRDHGHRRDGPQEHWSGSWRG